MARLKRRADGRFQKRVKVGTDGKRAVYKTVYGATLKELEAKTAELEEQETSSPSNRHANADLTFANWAETWFSTYKAEKAYNTRKQYRRMLDAYILPILGEKKLANVKPFNVRALMNGLTAKGLGSTAGLCLLTVRQILAAAVENEIIEKNVATSVKPPRTKKTAKSSLNKSERSLVLNAEKADKYGAFLFVLFFTGLRRGEALALTVDDVDLTARKIFVTKTVIFCPNVAVVKDAPKSAAGVREIPVADALFEVLSGYLPSLRGSVVFPDKCGGYMSLSAFRAFWTRCREWANLPESVTPHKFRHNFATELYYAGIDVKEAQRLLGHASAALTMETYTHLRADEGATVEKLNKIK